MPQPAARAPQLQPWGLALLLVICLGLNNGASLADSISADKANTSPSDSTEAGLPAGASEYNKGVELFQIAQVQKDKGNAEGQKKLLREAVRQFELALKTNPKLVEAQSNIGFAYLTLYDYRKAIGAFEKALAINPNHLNTLNGLSTAYAFNKNTEQAITTFNKLTTLDPGNSQYWFNKGSVLQKAGHLDEAEQAYLQALKVQPNDQRTLFNLGTLYENQGALEKARPYYEKAKGVEIGNSIGLEAIRRLEEIGNTLKKP